MDNSIRFEKLLKYGIRLRDRYLHFISAYKLFDELNKLSAPNKIGIKKAEANVNIFNKYKYFILTSKESLRCYFLIELSKFFDEDKKRNQTLSIQGIIEHALLDVNSFSTIEFKKYHKDRVIIPELFENFTPLSKKDLIKIKNRIEKNNNIINRVKNYRDKYLAHDDIEKIDIPLNKKDVDILLKIVKDTITLLYKKLDFSSNSYDNYEKEPIKNINDLVNDLKEYEQIRLDKLEKEYGFKIDKPRYF